MKQPASCEVCCLMTKSRSRREWVREEKGEHPSYFTLGEMANRLGLSQQTVERKIKSGTIPAHSAVTENGWRLWKPEHVRKAVSDKLRGRL